MNKKHLNHSKSIGDCKTIIGEFHGRFIEEFGDGTMVSFNTVSGAVYAAIKIQQACIAANDFQLRTGNHTTRSVFAFAKIAYQHDQMK